MSILFYNYGPPEECGVSVILLLCLRRDLYKCVALIQSQLTEEGQKRKNYTTDQRCFKNQSRPRFDFDLLMFTQMDGPQSQVCLQRVTWKSCRLCLQIDLLHFFSSLPLQSTIIKGCHNTSENRVCAPSRGDSRGGGLIRQVTLDKESTGSGPDLNY